MQVAERKTIAISTRVSEGFFSAGQSAVFFFYSRRRHTRLTCDWSSDVCSSDLLSHRRRLPSYSGGAEGRVDGVASRSNRRSEERRVGKECRYRWSPAK